MSRRCPALITNAFSPLRKTRPHWPFLRLPSSFPLPGRSHRPNPISMRPKVCAVTQSDILQTAEQETIKFEGPHLEIHVVNPSRLTLARAPFSAGVTVCIVPELTFQRKGLRGWLSSHAGAYVVIFQEIIPRHLSMLLTINPGIGNRAQIEIKPQPVFLAEK